MNRTGLGRHSGIDDASGDPLDGLVNLFDIGIVLAVAFLVAGLGLSVDKTTNKIEPRTTTTATTPTPQPQPGATTSGKGTSLGTLYRLSDGRLVVVEPDGRTRPVTP
ncbi:MAG TPA: DUF2149 domain-containing protein [Baekduia sp.]|uniref:DUF2149 domain-containing protein n=1 Tax=Baekduia sp. TaxID=2600305 RepID=UPI002D785F5F|nr:DUF2149 domain-containing protein [Baekduia sp.]HET6508061.1 DUF2149 domain-containing protein [Baekduia sp.]